MKLLAWVDQSFPAAKASLHAPASRAAIDQLRTLTGHPLPAALEALWLAHDGQDDAPGTRLFEGFALSSVEEARTAAAMMTQILEEVGREYGAAERWLPHWLPFAQDPGGGLLVVDLVSSEVFEWQSDGEGRERTWGSSFDDFLDTYLARFTRGELRVDPKNGVVETSPAPPLVRVAPVVPTKRKVLVLGLIALAFVAMIAFVSWLESRRGR